MSFLPTRGMYMQTRRTVRMTHKVSQHLRRNSFFNKHHDMSEHYSAEHVRQGNEYGATRCIIRSGASKPY